MATRCASSRPTPRGRGPSPCRRASWACSGSAATAWPRVLARSRHVLADVSRALVPVGRSLPRRRGWLYYWFSGRADALLKVAGQWVSPLEVEDCLLRHPAVKEVAVIGVERDGLVLTRAVVATRAPVTAEDLQTWVKDRLARYKYPREVVFVDALPRGDRGKVDRGALPR
ncbi:MAG: hypothetical protein R3F43_06785 [bacterium]